MQTVIASFTTVGEAEAARSALDAAGIPCRIGDENTISIDWLYSNALGGVKLLVDEEDRDDALEVLRQTPEDAPPELAENAEELEEDEPFGVEEPAQEVRLDCPACGSTAQRRIPRFKLFAVLSVVAIGVGTAAEEPGLTLGLIAAIAGALAFTPPVRCANCGERLSADAPAQRVEHVPLPDAEDVAEVRCARCGSGEVHRVTWRRFGASSMLPFVPLFFLAPFWILLPKWKCDNCGRRTWLRP